MIGELCQTRWGNWARTWAVGALAQEEFWGVRLGGAELQN